MLGSNQDLIFFQKGDLTCSILNKGLLVQGIKLPSIKENNEWPATFIHFLFPSKNNLTGNFIL